MSGPPRKPAALKRKLGNPGKQKLPANVVSLPASGKAPRAPAGLGKSGKAFWRRAWQNRWFSEECEFDLLTMCAQLLDERDELRADIKKHGRSFVTDKGYEAVRPAVSQLRTVEDQVTKWLVELGLTTRSRMGLGVADATRQSKLEELLERKASSGR